MRPVPLARAALVDRLADAAAGTPGRVRLAVDGAPEAGGDTLADELADVLRLRGRRPLRVGTRLFLRPASVRLEHGRRDPDALYDDALDVSGLRREVLQPLGPGGSGRYLPSLWDPDVDRATRAAYVDTPPDAVLVLDGTFLLRAVVAADLDVTVHLSLSPAALRRRGVPEWALPAYERYTREARPRDRADLVVLLDDPARPALLDRRTG